MVSCRNCEHGRYFLYCGAEGCLCEAFNVILSVEQADDDQVCDYFNEYMDSDDS